MTSVFAQNLIGYGPAGAGSVLDEVPALSPSFGWGGGPGVIRPPFAGAPRPAVAAIQGAIDVDNTVDVIYSTNGFATIERRTYQRLGCGGGPVLLPPLGIPAAIGPISGMAVDPVTKHLFLTNGAQIFRVNPLAGMAMVCGAMPAGTPGPLAGLDYDSTAGQLTGVDVAGNVATYNPCAGIVGWVAPTYAPPGGLAAGVARDKSAGGHLYVLWNNNQVYDQTAGAPWSVYGGPQVGLAYIASPVLLPVPPACGGVALQSAVNALATPGKATFGFSLCNVPAGVPQAWLLFGNAKLAAPMFGGLWLNPAAAVFVALGPFPVAAGSASVPMPLGLPAGARVYQQWVAICGGAMAFSNALQVEL